MEIAGIWSRAQTGDRTALEQLYDALRELVVGSQPARRLGPHDLEDLIQDVCTSIISQVRKLPFPTSLPGFVWNRSRSKSRGIVRRRGRLAAQAEGESPAAVDTKTSAPWRQLSDAEDRRAMRSCIGELPHEQSECVRRRYERGESIREIAKSEGVSCVTVHKRHRAALDALSRCIKTKGVTP